MTKYTKTKTKSQKIEILRKNDTSALRMIIKGYPLITKKWVILLGEVPFKKNDAHSIGTEHTVLDIRGDKKTISLYRRW